MLTFAFRITREIVFFAATVVIVGVGTKIPAVNPFAYAAFCLFVALGPFAWLGRSIVTKPGEEAPDSGFNPVADLIDTKWAYRLRVGLFLAQAVAVMPGAGVVGLVKEERPAYTSQNESACTQVEVGGYARQ